MGLLMIVIRAAIRVMLIVLMGAVIISWLRSFGVRVSRYNPVVRAIEDTAELMLRPIRRNVPTSGGGLDFAPAVAMIILFILLAIIPR